MSEAEKLATFLLVLQTSPTQRRKFKDDPVREMTRFNLSPKTIDAVLYQRTKILWKILNAPPIRTQVGKVAGVAKSPRRRSRRSR
jgi:hypothetical protein